MVAYPIVRCVTKERFDLDSGNLALDWANEVGGPGERLHLHEGHRLAQTYDDLVALELQAGELGRSEARALRRAASGRPAEADRVGEKAMALSRSIYRVFSAIAAGRKPPAADMALLAAAAEDANRRRRLVLVNGRLEWMWPTDDAALERVLWPVSGAAAQLLTAQRIEILRECASDTCEWLFLDRSRNRTKRWCSMSGCGNRAKARRHYERVRAKRGAKG